ncbi:MAG: FAS1-like dehydratase domain-containing protein [Candidatus Puniceispirillaceae bacterium]
MELDIDNLRSWIGSQQTQHETLSPSLVERFNATLGIDASVTAGDVAPLMIHFCLAQPVAGLDGLGPDGHPARGGFLPPVPLPRRMWAGGEITFKAPLIIGTQVTRQSTIENVEIKQGRSGGLCFVTVNHDYSSEGHCCVRERQDVVYRDPPAPDGADIAAPPDAAPAGTHHRGITPTPTMLFRYSAITFNGHRIHYDAPYAREVEGYGGLVVHGPLQATLMANMAAGLAGKPPKRFSFRGKSPLFDDAPFGIHAEMTGDEVSLWTARDGGPVAMQAKASW